MPILRCIETASMSFSNRAISYCSMIRCGRSLCDPYRWLLYSWTSRCPRMLSGKELYMFARPLIATNAAKKKIAKPSCDGTNATDPNAADKHTSVIVSSCLIRVQRPSTVSAYCAVQIFRSSKRSRLRSRTSSMRFRTASHRSSSAVWSDDRTRFVISQWNQLTTRTAGFCDIAISAASGLRKMLPLGLRHQRQLLQINGHSRSKEIAKYGK